MLSTRLMVLLEALVAVVVIALVRVALPLLGKVTLVETTQLMVEINTHRVVAVVLAVSVLMEAELRLVMVA